MEEEPQDKAAKVKEEEMEGEDKKTEERMRVKEEEQGEDNREENEANLSEREEKEEEEISTAKRATKD